MYEMHTYKASNSNYIMDEMKYEIILVQYFCQGYLYNLQK